MAAGHGGARARIALLCALLLSLVAVECAGKPSLNGTLAHVEPPAGWMLGEMHSYNEENLFDLVDGQAESFFLYNFQQVVTAQYENAAGDLVDLSVWQVATPADAFGLFTASRSGKPVAIGNDGEGDPGRRLAFWQDRYLAQVWARQELPQADILAFAQALAAALPTGGERPDLLAQLPEPLRGQPDLIYFHQELSIESRVWLGGENILGLSPETEGVLVRLPAEAGGGELLLVRYPQAQGAADGQQALVGGQVDDLVACRAQGRLLAAVFGQVSDDYTQQILTQTLGG